jgi:hypothetical protein
MAQARLGRPRHKRQGCGQVNGDDIGEHVANAFAVAVICLVLFFIFGPGLILKGIAFLCWLGANCPPD